MALGQGFLGNNLFPQAGDYWAVDDKSIRTSDSLNMLSVAELTMTTLDGICHEDSFLFSYQQIR